MSISVNDLKALIHPGSTAAVIILICKKYGINIDQSSLDDVDFLVNLRNGISGMSDQYFVIVLLLYRAGESKYAQLFKSSHFDLCACDNKLTLILQLADRSQAFFQGHVSVEKFSYQVFIESLEIASTALLPKHLQDGVCNAFHLSPDILSHNSDSHVEVTVGALNADGLLSLANILQYGLMPETMGSAQAVSSTGIIQNSYAAAICYALLLRLNPHHAEARKKLIQCFQQGGQQLLPNVRAVRALSAFSSQDREHAATVSAYAELDEYKAFIALDFSCQTLEAEQQRLKQYNPHEFSLIEALVVLGIMQTVLEPRYFTSLVALGNGLHLAPSALAKLVMLRKQEYQKTFEILKTNAVVERAWFIVDEFVELSAMFSLEKYCNCPGNDVPQHVDNLAERIKYYVQESRELCELTLERSDGVELIFNGLMMGIKILQDFDTLMSRVNDTLRRLPSGLEADWFRQQISLFKSPDYIAALLDAIKKIYQRFRMFIDDVLVFGDLVLTSLQDMMSDNYRRFYDEFLRNWDKSQDVKKQKLLAVHRALSDLLKPNDSEMPQTFKALVAVITETPETTGQRFLLVQKEFAAKLADATRKVSKACQQAALVVEINKKQRELTERLSQCDINHKDRKKWSALIRIAAGFCSANLLCSTLEATEAEVNQYLQLFFKKSNADIPIILDHLAAELNAFISIVEMQNFPISSELPKVEVRSDDFLKAKEKALTFNFTEIHHFQKQLKKLQNFPRLEQAAKLKFEELVLQAQLKMSPSLVGFCYQDRLKMLRRFIRQEKRYIKFLEAIKILQGIKDIRAIPGSTYRAKCEAFCRQYSANLDFQELMKLKTDKLIKFVCQEKAAQGIVGRLKSCHPEFLRKTARIVDIVNQLHRKQLSCSGFLRELNGEFSQEYNAIVVKYTQLIFDYERYAALAPIKKSNQVKALLDYKKEAEKTPGIQLVEKYILLSQRFKRPPNLRAEAFKERVKDSSPEWRLLLNGVISVDQKFDESGLQSNHYNLVCYLGLPFKWVSEDIPNALACLEQEFQAFLDIQGLIGAVASFYPSRANNAYVQFAQRALKFDFGEARHFQGRLEKLRKWQSAEQEARVALDEKIQTIQSRYEEGYLRQKVQQELEKCTYQEVLKNLDGFFNKEQKYFDYLVKLKSLRDVENIKDINGATYYAKYLNFCASPCQVFLDFDQLLKLSDEELAHFLERENGDRRAMMQLLRQHGDCLRRHPLTKKVVSQFQQRALSYRGCLEELDECVGAQYRNIIVQYDSLEANYRACYTVLNPSELHIAKIKELVDLKNKVNADEYKKPVEKYMLLLDALKKARDEARGYHLSGEPGKPHTEIAKFFKQYVTRSDFVEEIERILINHESENVVVALKVVGSPGMM